MKTKYHIISGGVSREVAVTDIKNWDEIEFTLERKDYSGVMRSFSSEFKFVGAAFTLLRDLYLADGFLADAAVAVSTKNDDWTYTEQFRCPLDFSTVEIENGTITINAIDNTLAGLLKSKKGQKYEISMSDLYGEEVRIYRMAFANSVKYKLPNTNNSAGIVDARIDESASIVVSTEYVEPADESSGYDGVSVNRFFAKVNTAPSPLLRVSMFAIVRCPLSIHNTTGTVPIAHMRLGYWDSNENRFVQAYVLFDNDVTRKFMNGTYRQLWIGGSTKANYATVNDLNTAATSGTYGSLMLGMFGVVGPRSSSGSDYWSDNVVYEYTGSGWTAMGAPADYKQDRFMNVSGSLNMLATYQYPMLSLDNAMRYFSGEMTMTWEDTARDVTDLSGIRPGELLSALVGKISPTSTASIASDAAGLLSRTYIIPAEALRRMADAKAYTTFQQFADWMEAVFGYTYRVVGNEVQFVHRSEVFNSSAVKHIEEVRDVKYSVEDNLIYSEINAGYSKKEYGEINGRLETNFTNYYATDYNVTDKKLSLISKYRADSYGIEFTLRKGDNQSETKDDKSDEDVFVLCADVENSILVYRASNNDAYSPYWCASKNSEFIAAMGNGAAVALKMTSSDGNNALADITIPAGTALFSAGVLEFTTDDMTIPEDWDGLVSIDHNGYRFRGFIIKASARYGRQNGMEYELIIKDITEL